MSVTLADMRQIARDAFNDEMSLLCYAHNTGRIPVDVRGARVDAAWRRYQRHLAELVEQPQESPA